MRRLTRRALLRDTVGVAGAAAIAPLLAPARVLGATPPGPSGAVPFSGRHQAGIATPQQPHACVAAFDLTHDDGATLRGLLQRWSAAAARMTRGLPGLPGPERESRPPLDTGEALGLLPARLTVTLGLGIRLFSAIPELRAARPSALRPLPAFPGDRLDARIGEGDLLVQACADDPVVAFHAARMLTRLAGGDAGLRWTLQGFLPVLPATPATPRNLMGFRDGTANPIPGDGVFDRTVWVGDGDEPAWLRGGSYLVMRRIRMRLGRWDASDLGEQQGTFGRDRPAGAPLSGGTEFTPPNFEARGPDGALLIPLDAHMRRAHHSFNGGARLLRRAYSYTDGALAGGEGTGDIDAGLLFLAYMRDPAQFVRIQRSLAALDHLNEYVVHVASALFAVPPGARDGGYVGETLLG